MFPGRSGDYYLFAYNLENRPIGPQRPGAIPTQVVVQPHGTEAHKWHFESAGDSKYRITLGHLAATDVDNFVKLMKIPPPPTEWMILPQITAPPSPEPLYKIFVPSKPEDCWYVDRTSGPLVEPPVKLFADASSIRIVPVD